MFGVFSLGNYDMRRLLTDYSFSGFPLRKTFPMTGFFEQFYEDFFQRINAELVGLRQAYRTFFYNKYLALKLIELKVSKKYNFIYQGVNNFIQPIGFDNIFNPTNICY